MAASYGGWTRLDTPEMAAQRVERDALARAKSELVQSRQKQSVSDKRPEDDAALGSVMEEAARQAETEFQQGTDGRRLVELESQLRKEVATSARREQWQIAVVAILFIAGYIAIKLLNH
jgi:hypothetical protein